MNLLNWVGQTFKSQIVNLGVSFEIEIKLHAFHTHRKLNARNYPVLNSVLDIQLKCPMVLYIVLYLVLILIKCVNFGCKMLINSWLDLKIRQGSSPF
jgi:hypothetical protein